MGLFDILKKKSSDKVESSVREPSCEDLAQQRKQESTKEVRNYQKDTAGLYPHEIIMLSYLEKYADGKEPARFWEREYCVDDVPALIKSLEERGFAKNGKLTDCGRSEIDRNEYVLYMHRNKFSDISMADMSILVNSHPDMNFRDLIWGELNRLSLKYMQNRQFGWYRNTKYRMYQFVLEEKRYANAFLLLSETFFYDLNGNASPSIAPALIDDLRKLERKLNYSDSQMIEKLQALYKGMFAPHRNYTNDEVTCIIVAYAFGHDEMAQQVFNRKMHPKK